MKRDFESLGRVRLQAALLLAVVFALGLFLGFTGGRLQHGQRPGPPPKGFRGLPPHFQDRLDLTDEQSRRIDAVIAARKARIDEVLETYLPELRALTDSMRTDIRAILTPEQREVFDQLDREPGGPRNGGPGHHGPDHGPDGGRRPPPPPQDGSRPSR
ncbi:hypothetical protein KDM41_06735 [bacterium]|nr:hypothetical protein [bacterium]